jgi:hypothetical protein
LTFVEQNNIYDEWDLKEIFDDQNEVAQTSPVALFVCPERRTASEAISDPVEVNVTAPCGCPMGTRWVPAGALGDYAGNAGDLSPGAIGAPTDFYQPGCGTGVMFTSRTTGDLQAGPTGWKDKISTSEILDGSSNTLLAGEAHKPISEMKLPPTDAPIYSGYEFPSIARVGGPGAPIVRNRFESSETSVFQWGSWHPDSCNFVLADGSTQTFNLFMDPEVLRRLSHRADGGRDASSGND